MMYAPMQEGTVWQIEQQAVIGDANASAITIEDEVLERPKSRKTYGGRWCEGRAPMVIGDANAAAITDAAATVSKVASCDRDNRLLGLSRLQRQILGVARTGNEYTGASNVPHFTTPLGVFAIYGIRPDYANELHRYERTRRAASAQAAMSRALTRLLKRGLLVYRSWDERTRAGHGHMLTAALDIEPVAVPAIDQARRFFQMKDVICRWQRDEHGQWQR